MYNYILNRVITAIFAAVTVVVSSSLITVNDIVNHSKCRALIKKKIFRHPVRVQAVSLFSWSVERNPGDTHANSHARY